MVLQLEYQPKKNTGHLKLSFVFCWLRNHLAAENQSSMPGFIKGFRNVKEQPLNVNAYIEGT